MSQSLQFFSTNHNAPKLTFGEALLQGLAPDKGLYMPESIPTFTTEEIESFTNKEYFEIAFEVFKKFFRDDIPHDELLAMCKDAYNFDVPLEKVYERKYIMRLDQGPTASFKDFAGQMLGRLMQYYLKQLGTNKLILTATSGDTGSAIAYAFYKMQNIKVVILFPENEVSPRQRKQMTRLGENIKVIAINGKFDDAQAMVKEAFSDSDLTSLNLTSANSINIGRLIPQIVYYFYSYAQKRKNKGEQAIFCIPSGNFGDMMGCVFAKKMGLPIKKILVATNTNNEFEVLLKTKQYKKIEPSKNCLSSAMNVGHPSNLARLIELYGGNMDELGNIKKQPDFEALQRDFYALSVTDEETNQTIKKAWDNYNELLLEYHGAVGWKCVETYLKDYGNNADELIISLETAHPAKFPLSTSDNLGKDSAKILNEIFPESLKGIDTIADIDEFYDQIEGNYTDFKDYLLKNLTK